MVIRDNNIPLEGLAKLKEKLKSLKVMIWNPKEENSVEKDNFKTPEKEEPRTEDCLSIENDEVSIYEDSDED